MKATLSFVNKMKWNVLASQNSSKDLLNILLKNRGVADTELNEFLNPPAVTEYFKRFSTDFKISIKCAVSLVFEAINKRQKIVIFGDYDVDGICATAILYLTIKNVLHYENVSYFIPNRFEHGYGLSQKAINAVLEKNPDEKLCFITVDTGITGAAEVDILNKNGHTVIITDHHQKPPILPAAPCIIWNDEIVGSTISWFLSKALGSEVAKHPAKKDASKSEPVTDQSFYQTMLSLCALATVTDVFPLKGINRSIVKTGLEILNKTPHLGIKKLLELAGRSANGHFEVSVYDLGWVIGPRLNASGRLFNAESALKLLIEDDPEVITEIATELNKVNVERQDKTLEMYSAVENFDATNLPKIIVSHSESFHEGIIGLVASKIVQKYYRPAVVISVSESFGKGSVRSIPGVNIIELLRKADNLFEELGGHPMAAGFSIKKENILQLQEILQNLATDVITEDLLDPVLNVDIEIPLNIVNLTLLKDIEKMKPFGLGNSEPLFLSTNIAIADTNRMGKEKQHLLIKLFDGTNIHKALLFDAAKTLSFALGEKIDVVYTLSKNEFNGKTYVDLIIKDWRKSSN